MGSLMDGLDAEAYDRTYKDSQIFRRLASYFSSQKGLIVSVLLLIFLSAALETTFPVLLSFTLDNLVAKNIIQNVLIFSGLIMLTSVVSWLCNLFRQWQTARIAGDGIFQLRKDTFTAIMERDLSFFDTFSSGKIISRVTSDTESIISAITIFLNLLSQTLLVLFIAIALLIKDWKLALLSMAIFPGIIAVTLGFRFLARRSTRYTQRSFASLNAVVQEVMSGITVAKSFRQEQSTYDTFRRANLQYYRLGVRTFSLFGSVYPLLGTMIGIGTTIVVYFGGLSVLDHTISSGDWFLFVQCISLLWVPLTSISSFWSQFQLGLSASERVFALLDTTSHVHQIDQQQMSEVAGKIEFKDLSFCYDVQQLVLVKFNLTIHPGEKVAFVGHTGAGKTSLAKLIARFYEFQEGQLLIDGHDIRTLDLHKYRLHLGFVPQEPFLFSGTVAENIKCAQHNATDEEVLSTASQIGRGDWIKTLPDGLETQVGEAGKTLSRGQRQLVTLARILLQNPSIIILDEATASVDPITEAQIQEGLDLVLKNRTAILIAHRLSTVKHADRIIVLDQGRIIEEGNHTELTEKGGYYAQVYNMYFRHQSADYVPGGSFIPEHIQSGPEKKTVEPDEIC